MPDLSFLEQLEAQNPIDPEKQKRMMRLLQAQSLQEAPIQGQSTVGEQLLAGISRMPSQAASGIVGAADLGISMHNKVLDAGIPIGLASSIFGKIPSLQPYRQAIDETGDAMALNSVGDPRVLQSLDAENSMTQKITQGAASILPTLAVAPLGIGAAATAGGVFSAGNTYNELTETGAKNPEMAALAAGLITAALSRAMPGGVESVAQRTVTTPVTNNILIRTGTAAATGAVKEGFEEGLDTLLGQSAVAGITMDPNRMPTGGDIGESALLGAILGGPISAVTEISGAQPAPAPRQPTLEEVLMQALNSDPNMGPAAMDRSPVFQSQLNPTGPVPVQPWAQQAPQPAAQQPEAPQPTDDPISAILAELEQRQQDRKQAAGPIVEPDINAMLAEIAQEQQPVPGTRKDYDATISRLGMDPAQVEQSALSMDDVVQQPPGEPVAIAQDGDAGQGVIAAAPIPQGQPITLTTPTGERTEAGRFINHSSEANAIAQFIDGAIRAIPVRPIAQGEPIRIDYAQAAPVIEQQQEAIRETPAQEPAPIPQPEKGPAPQAPQTQPVKPTVFSGLNATAEVRNRADGQIGVTLRDNDTNETLGTKIFPAGKMDAALDHAKSLVRLDQPENNAPAPQTQPVDVPRGTVEPVAEAAPIPPAPQAEIQPAKKKPVFKAPMWQGRGKSLAEVYGEEAVQDGRAGPLFGKAQYYAFTKPEAEYYGKATTHEVELTNPFVLDSDDKWRKLLKDADAPHLDNMSELFYRESNKVLAAGEKVQAHIKALGHDGIVVKLGQGDIAKRLKAMAGHDQVVVFAKDEAPAPAANQPTNAVVQPTAPVVPPVAEPTPAAQAPQPTDQRQDLTSWRKAKKHGTRVFRPMPDEKPFIDPLLGVSVVADEAGQAANIEPLSLDGIIVDGVEASKIRRDMSMDYRILRALKDCLGV